MFDYKDLIQIESNIETALEVAKDSESNPKEHEGAIAYLNEMLRLKTLIKNACMFGKTIKYYDVAGTEQQGTVEGIFTKDDINWIVIHRPVPSPGTYHEDYIQYGQIIQE